MDPFLLTPSQARKIILHAAGLAKRAQFGKGKEAVFKLIDHLGFVQVDTNYVVERAHHHSIYTRVPDYQPEWVDHLQEEGRIFEFWTYASGYIPMHEFRFSFPVKAALLARRKPLSPQELSVMKMVYDRIAREGPLMARDFDNDRVTKSTGWWDWRPSKLALERLHFEGQLMTAGRRDFQKIYDLPDNIVPTDIDKTPPTSEEFSRHIILRSLKSMGVATYKDIAFASRYTKSPLKEVLDQLIATGEVCRAELVGLKGTPIYMLPSYKRKKLNDSQEVFILSPFDTLIVFRNRLKMFFNFHYMVECFVPKPKRKYGYFSLPVLFGDTFIARMDTKADRKHRTLIIHNLYFEQVKVTKPMIAKLIKSIRAFANFNQCDKIVVEKCSDKGVLRVIRDI